MKYYKPHFTNEEIKAHIDYCHSASRAETGGKYGNLTPDSHQVLNDNSILYPSVAQKLHCQNCRTLETSVSFLLMPIRDLKSRGIK